MGGEAPGVRASRQIEIARPRWRRRRLGRIRAVYRGWWIVLNAFLSQFAATGSSGWVFGVLVLSMQEDLDTTRSAIVGVLFAERLLGGVSGAVLGPFIDRNGARLPVTALVDQFYKEVQQIGGRRWDTSSLMARLER